MPPAPCPAAGASPTSPALRSHPARGSALSCSRPPLARLPSDRVPCPASPGRCCGAEPGRAREEHVAGPVPPRAGRGRELRCRRGGRTPGAGAACTCGAACGAQPHAAAPAGGVSGGGRAGTCSVRQGEAEVSPPPPTRLCPEGSSCALRGRWSAPRAERRVETEGR